MANPHHGNQEHPSNGLNIINPSHDHEVVVVMVPLPAQGHINQLLHLSRLIAAYNIPVYYVGAAAHNRQATLRVQGWNPNSIKNIHFLDFLVPPFNSPPPNPNSQDKFPSHLLPSFRAARHLRHPVTALLRRLSEKARRIIIIHDSLMASVVQDAALIPNTESFTFHSISAFAIFLFYWDGMKKVQLEVDAKNIIPKDVPSLEGCLTSEMMDFIAAQYEFNKYNSGNLYNTSRVMERPYMDLLVRILPNKKHWALGPFNPVELVEKKVSNDKHMCLEWLDKQAPNSVIYVSFGTTTTFTEEQIQELALGLEQSGQKFMWVLRYADKGVVFDDEVIRKVELPKGYEESVRNKGIVVRDWAPQLEILGHPSTGGFLSHCGWNSCIESITMGVPIGAWPMHSDQPRNTVLVTELLGVGTVVRDWNRRNEVATAAAVVEGVRKLMESKEGEHMRKRAAELGSAVRQSAAAEDGASRKELDAFIAHISR
ncbi:Zeatin O-glucosyltransferase [Morus notabilis]|uniref:Glycosyltransferase n=1 Tax=Morus notabilis TaxID=981085 RepID=W9QPX8_9ROSA|nr:zeatin O-glucosyltransferase [Morus notabilis]EXB50176.1 Zeatin O-glucosyltransferase [Morus notabilis]